MRTALVTGSNRGLGKHLCNELHNNKIIVIPHVRNDRSCARSIVGDINKEITTYRIVQAMSTHGVDVFINNAGIYANKKLLEYSTEEIRDIINTNLTSQILMIQSVYRYFKKLSKGLIININSLASRHPSACESIYSASKCGLHGFSKALQIESIGTGIKIIDFYIGAMKTDMCADRANYNELIDPKEVAEFITSIILNKHTSYYPPEIVIRRT